MTRPYTPEELDRLHAAGLSAVGHYNTPRTESDGEIVLGVLAGNDRYLKPAYCAGIRAEAARMEAERDPDKSDLLTELDRVKARFATRCDECAELRAEFARVTAERNAPDLIGHSEWLRGVEAECARILGVDADGDIRETAAQCVKERDAANERADKAERERDEARGELDDIDTLLARTDLEGSREDRIGALFNSIGELTAECDTCKATIDGNDRTVHNVMVADLAAALGPGSPLNWTILIEAVKAVEVKRAFLSAEAARLMAERDAADRTLAAFRKVLAVELPGYAETDGLTSLEYAIRALRGEVATVLAERDAAVSMGTQLERERDEARESLRRVNRRCQAAESRVATFDFLLAHRGVPMPVDSYQQASAAVAELMALYGAREKVATLSALVKEAGEALGPMVAMREARESWYDPSDVRLLYRDLVRAAEVAARCAKVGEGQ